jgi:hypothetical protein
MVCDSTDSKIPPLDSVSHAISFLGTLPNPEGVHEPAIVRIEKTALPESSATEFAQIVHDIEKIEHTDIVCHRFFQIGEHLLMVLTSTLGTSVVSGPSETSR